MKVRDLSQNIQYVSANSTIAEVAAKMANNKTGSVLVQDGFEYIGVITERDILRKLLAMNKDPKKTMAKDVMSSPVITIDSDEDLELASDKMAKHSIRRLYITENGRITGKVTSHKIANNLKYLLAGGLNSSLR